VGGRLGHGVEPLHTCCAVGLAMASSHSLTQAHATSSPTRSQCPPSPSTTLASIARRWLWWRTRDSVSTSAELALHLLELAGEALHRRLATVEERHAVQTFRSRRIPRCGTCRSCASPSSHSYQACRLRQVPAQFGSILLQSPAGQRRD
jgi:hypothetical protein